MTLILIADPLVILTVTPDAFAFVILFASMILMPILIPIGPRGSAVGAPYRRRAGS